MRNRLRNANLRFDVGALSVRQVTFTALAFIVLFSGCAANVALGQERSGVTAKQLLRGLKFVVDRDALDDPPTVEKALGLTGGWEGVTYHVENGPPLELRRASGWNGQDEPVSVDYSSKTFAVLLSRDPRLPLTLNIDRPGVSTFKKRFYAQLSISFQSFDEERTNRKSYECFELLDILNIWAETRTQMQMHSAPLVGPRLPGVDYVQSTPQIEGLWGVSIYPPETKRRYTLDVSFGEKRCARYLNLIVELQSRR